jgi:hypothetical protein
LTGEGTVNLGLLAAGNKLISETIVPHSLRGIYTSKIDNMLTYQQIVLKYAAVIGG